MAVETPSALTSMTHLHDGAPMRWQVVPDRQAICRSDDDNVLGSSVRATPAISTASGC